jgi:protein TonB
MTPKKNPNADLERKRPIFFLIGISLTLVGLITVFQWTTTYTVEVLPETEPREELFTADAIVTYMSKPKVVEQKKTEPNHDILAMVDKLPADIKLTEPSLIDDDGDLDELLNDIVDLGGNDARDLEGIETLMPRLVQRVAAPLECEDIGDRELRNECLNDYMLRFISENVVYPEFDKKMGNEGTVFVSFIISEKGKVKDIVLKGDYKGLNAEAKRVIKALPDFSPASHNGRKVRMQMGIPVSFSLN